MNRVEQERTHRIRLRDLFLLTAWLACCLWLGAMVTRDQTRFATSSLPFIVAAGSVGCWGLWRRRLVDAAWLAVIYVLLFVLFVDRPAPRPITGWAVAFELSPAFCGTIVGLWIGHPVRSTLLAILACIVGAILGSFIGNTFAEPAWVPRLEYLILHGWWW